MPKYKIAVNGAPVGTSSGMSAAHAIANFIQAEAHNPRTNSIFRGKDGSPRQVLKITCWIYKKQ